MPEKEYRLLELHANEFVGRFLVPIEALEKQFNQLLSEVEQKGLARTNFNDEPRGISPDKSPGVASVRAMLGPRRLCADQGVSGVIR